MSGMEKKYCSLVTNKYETGFCKRKKDNEWNLSILIMLLIVGLPPHTRIHV